MQPLKLAAILRGYVGVHNIVSGPMVVPLNIFVIIHQIHLKAHWFTGITCTQHHKSYAFTYISIVHLGPPHIPLREYVMVAILW